MYHWELTVMRTMVAPQSDTRVVMCLVGLPSTGSMYGHTYDPSGFLSTGESNATHPKETPCARTCRPSRSSLLPSTRPRTLR